MGTISKNNIITLNRGDTFTFTQRINLGSEMCPDYYKLINTDKLYLGVMECNKPFEKAIIRQIYTLEDQNDDLEVLYKFKPDDTLYLLPGRYYYEIKLARENGDVYTITPKTIFYILE